MKHELSASGSIFFRRRVTALSIDTVDRSVERRPIAALEHVHDVVARQNTFRALHEDLEEIEFRRGQLLHLAGCVCDLATRLGWAGHAVPDTAIGSVVLHA